MGVRANRDPVVELEAHTRGLGADLSWLSSVLWPGGDVRLSPTRVPPGRRVAEAYAVIPNASRPRLLVPFSSPSLAERAMRRYDDAMPRTTRTRRRLAARLAASTLGWSRFAPLVVFFEREPRPGELLTQHLRDVFDLPDLVLAISFGPARPNRKPVVQAMTLDGDVVGFGKVGWNRSTDALVRSEVGTLRRWARRPPTSFRVPTVLHDGDWSEHALGITAPLPTGASSGRTRRDPRLDAMLEIAKSGGVSVMPLGSTPWWRSVRDRAGVAGGATHPAADGAAVVLRWMQELHGRRLMWHGSSHGDWSAQNMATVAGRLYVWDWERMRDGVPLGLDAIHYAFQAAVRARPDVPRATRLAVSRSGSALRALGVPREDDALLVACYLAELLVRFEEGRRQGAAVRAGMPEALLAELRRWVARA